MKFSGISRKRAPLRPGERLTLSNSESYLITDVLSEGGFSLTYLAKKTGAGSSPLMVLKELFPAELKGGYAQRINGTITCCSRFSSLQAETDSQWHDLIQDLTREVTLARRACQVFIPGSDHAFQSTDYLAADGPFTDQHGNYYVLYDTHKGISLDHLICSGWASREDRGKKRNSQLPLILSVLTELSAKLQMLHTNHILHLDISPANVFLALTGGDTRLLPFLIDFGSALDTADEEAVRQHRYTSNACFSAPELFPLAEYNTTDCGFSASPASDTYSIAAILFWAVTGANPNKEYASGPWDLLIERLFPKTVYGDLAERFIRFFIQALSPWADRRFCSADALYEALKSLEYALRSHKGLLGSMSAESKAACSMLLSAPLHRYTAEDKEIRVLFWGTQDAMDQILRAAFSAGQVLDRPLSFAVIAPDAEEYRDRLLKACPDLPRFTNLGGDTVTEELYGSFYFDTQAKTAEEIAEVYAQYRYIVVSHGSTTANKNAAEALLAAFQRRGISPGVIHYVGSAIERDSALQLESLDAGAVIRPCFAGSNPPAELELEQKAFAVHWAYCRPGEAQPEAALAALRETEMGRFASGTAYNQESSAAVVLHSPAKLASLGFPAQTTAEEWSQSLKGEEALTKLLTLEHRRWTAFMLMQGYRAPVSEEEILSYAFKNGSSKFHSEERKIHPCLVPSSAPVCEALFQSPPNPGALDPLDQVSLRLHALAERIKDRQHPVAQAFLDIIRMLSEDPIHQKLCNDMEGELDALFSGQNRDPDFDWYKNAFRKQGTPCDLPLEGIRQNTRAAFEYASRKNYKYFDKKIVDVIAELLK